jgi:hypothetical protein
MANYLVHPETLISRAKGYITGFNDMVEEVSISEAKLNEIAVEVAQEWTNDWDEGEGFGSSDSTFMLKEFIDSIINCFTDRSYYTDFKPTLQVIKK